MKKNILILVTEAIGGGVERLILDQMKYFDRSKFNLHILTLRKGYLEEEFANTYADYLCLDVKKRISLQTIRNLLHYTKQYKIDVVHTHLYLPDIYGFLIKILNPKIKLISTKHNTNEFRKKIHWGLLDKLLSLPASQIIAVSKSVKKFISRYEFIPPQKIKVIYHGVDISRFTKTTSIGNLRKKFQIKKTDFVIGIVGRITAQKGHIYLLQAVAKLKSNIPNIKLLVIGTGELQQELSNSCRILNIENQVKFLGFRQNMPELYRIMDILCLPSIYEGLGLVLVEAMLCNTITIGANIHGITEIIEDGVNGFLVPPRDVSALVHVIHKIHKLDYDHSIIKRAKQSALEFDYRKNLKKIEHEYLTIV